MSEQESAPSAELAVSTEPSITPVVATPVPMNQELLDLIDSLPAIQQLVLNCLLTGESITSAADQSDVSRTTIYRWLAADPAFKTAYEGSLQITHLQVRKQLHLMSERAATVLSHQLM